MNPDNVGFKFALITNKKNDGIRKVFSKCIMSRGKKVIIAGRAKPGYLKLQMTARKMVRQHLRTNLVLNMGNILSIPTFIGNITSENLELNCLVNNAAVQRLATAGPRTRPGGFKRGAKGGQEISINIPGPMHQAIGLLPYLMSKPKAMIINVSSILGYVPFSILNTVYNDTTVWVHF